MPRRKRSICHHKTFTTLSHPADKFRRHWRQIGGMTKQTRRNHRAADAGRAYPRVAGRSADILVGLFVWPRRGNPGTRRQECRRSPCQLAHAPDADYAPTRSWNRIGSPPLVRSCRLVAICSEQPPRRFRHRPAPMLRGWGAGPCATTAPARWRCRCWSRCR